MAFLQKHLQNSQVIINGSGITLIGNIFKLDIAAVLDRHSVVRGKCMHCLHREYRMLVVNLV